MGNIPASYSGGLDLKSRLEISFKDQDFHDWFLTVPQETVRDSTSNWTRT